MTKQCQSNSCPFTLQSVVSKEAGGRSSAAGEGAFDPGQLRLARCFCAVIMASPGIGGGSSVMGTRDVVHLLFGAIRSLHLLTTFATCLVDRCIDRILDGWLIDAAIHAASAMSLCNVA